MKTPELCKGCYRWDKWKTKCVYYWKDKGNVYSTYNDNKPFCPSKVRDEEELFALSRRRETLFL